ncbi:MAG: magnesium transporter [Bacteroidota bacterium]
MSEVRSNIERVKSILVHSVERAKPLLKDLHPSDLADILEEITPESRMILFKMLPVETASDAISEMDEDSNPEELLLSISPQRAAKIIEELDPDDAADLLAQLPRSDLRLIMERLGDEEEKVIQSLMTYDEDSAGGLMNPDVLAIPEDWTKRQAMEEVIRISEEMEDFYAIYVVDDENRLQGVVPLKRLIRARPHTRIGELLAENLVTVFVEMDQEEVAQTILKYNLAAVPVVDTENHLLGRITFDDIMDVLQEESTEDILKIAGVSEDEDLDGGWVAAVRSRLPWLLINLCTASTAGFVISRFSNAIDQLVLIASFMPIVAGVAGNGATQALAVTIRRIATEGIVPKQYVSVVVKELAVGLTNGILLGLVVGLVAWWLGGNPLLGLVVLAAMIGNLLVAGFAGSAIPLFLQRLGVDPAVASSILMTAFTDILGYTLLLGLASLILGLT